MVAHDAVRVHYRRRGLLPWQGYCLGGARRPVAGARVCRAAAQARSLFERRSGNDESRTSTARCIVTDDGAETDLDLGHYERFTGVPANRLDNATTGRIYPR